MPSLKIYPRPWRIVEDKGYLTVIDDESSPVWPLIDLELGWTDIYAAPYVAPEQDSEVLHYIVDCVNTISKQRAR